MSDLLRWKIQRFFKNGLIEWVTYLGEKYKFFLEII
jgi:hypothetical protein